MDKKKISPVRMGIGLLGFLIMPVVSFYFFETVTGNLASIEPFEAFLNICFNYCLYLILLGLSGTTRIAVPVSSIFLFAMSLAETFVIDFRSRPIMPWDITALSTALSVTKNYSFIPTESMKTAGAVILAANIILLFFPFKVKGLKHRFALFGGCTAIAAGFLFAFYSKIIPIKNYEINVWDVNSTYESDGYMLSSAIAMKYVVVKPPTGYSQANVEKIYNQIESGNVLGKDIDNENAKASDGSSSDQTAATGSSDTGDASSESLAIQPVNIICIMNESFSDLSVAGDFETNIDYMPFWHSLTENTIKGSLCVPVFGSMTSNTEFEFLTGDSISILPFNSNAYQFNVKEGALSLVSTLKAQGYKATAMHPYPAENWNRKRCYENFGFDEFYDFDSYDGCEFLRNYVSDKADFQKLIEQVEDKDSPEDKLFLFNVTMQNHGGYDSNFDNFVQEVRLTGDLEGKYPETDRYLSLIKKSDEALEYLINYFSQCDEPTMIVMFGDHQPSVEDEFFNEICGMNSDDVATENRIMWFQTPFMIWTNYEQPSQDIGKLSAIYLSSYMLNAAGLKTTPYNKYLLALSEDVPIIHPYGCYDKNGTYYYWGQAESYRCPYGTEILNYKYLAYNHSLDTKKNKKLFSIEDD